MALTGTYLGGSEDVLDGLGDLRADTVTLNQADEEVALLLVVSTVLLMPKVYRGRDLIVLSDFHRPISQQAHDVPIDDQCRPRCWGKKAYLCVLGSLVLGDTVTTGRVEPVLGLWKTVSDEQRRIGLGW